MEPELVSFENDYLQGRHELDADKFSEGAVACVTIDGYPADEDAQGTVVCVVWLTTDRKFIVDWHHNGYRMNDAVLELVEDAKRTLSENYIDGEDAVRNDAVEKARDILSDGHMDAGLGALVDLYAICHWEPMFSNLVRGLTRTGPMEFVAGRAAEMGLRGYGLPGPKYKE